MTAKQYNMSEINSKDELSPDEIAVKSTLSSPNDIARLLSDDKSSINVFNDIQQHKEHEAEGASGLKYFQFTRTVKANGVELKGKPDCEVQGKTIPLINGLSLDLSPSHLKMKAGFLDFQNAYVESGDNEGGDLYAFFPSIGTMLQVPVEKTRITNNRIIATTNSNETHEMNNVDDTFSMKVFGFVQEGDQSRGILNMGNFSINTRIGNDQLKLDNIFDKFEYNENGMIFPDNPNVSSNAQCLHITPIMDIVNPKVTMGKEGLLKICVKGDFKLNEDFCGHEVDDTTEITMTKYSSDSFKVHPFSLPKINMTLNGYQYEIFEPQSTDGKNFRFSRGVFKNELFKDTEIDGGTLDENGIANDFVINHKKSNETSSTPKKNTDKKGKAQVEEDFIKATDDGIVKIKFPQYSFENKHDNNKTESNIKGTGYISVEGLKLQTLDKKGKKYKLYNIDDLKPDPNDKVEFTSDGQGKISTNIGDLEGAPKENFSSHIIFKDAKVENGELKINAVKLDVANEIGNETDSSDNYKLTDKQKDLIDMYAPINFTSTYRKNYDQCKYDDGTITTNEPKGGIGKIEISAIGDHLGASIDVEEGKYEISLSNSQETDGDKGSLSIFDSSNWKSGVDGDIPLFGPVMLSLSLSGKAGLSYGLKAGLEVGGKKKGDKITATLGGEISAPMEASLEFGLGVGVANVASVYGGIFAKAELKPKFSIGVSTEFELVENEKKPGKLKPQFMGDVRIDLHGEATPTISVGINAGIKILIWKGQLYSVTLAKKELANIQFNKGIVHNKDGTWDFKDSEFTIDVLGKNMYELARNKDNGIFETKEEGLYYNLSATDGKSFENALKFLNDIRAFRNENQVMYDKNEFGLAMSDGIAVRKKFVETNDALEKQLVKKKTEYEKMIANNEVLKLIHMGDMMKHEDNMLIMGEALNGIKSGGIKMSDILGEIRDKTGFNDYNVYTQEKVVGGAYAQQIKTRDMFRMVDEETENNQIAENYKANSILPDQNTLAQNFDYEDLKYFYKRNLVNKGKENKFDSMSASVYNYRKNHKLLGIARDMFHGQSKSYRANIESQFGSESKEMENYKYNCLYYESYMKSNSHEELFNSEDIDDETFIANEFAEKWAEIANKQPEKNIDEKGKKTERIRQSKEFTKGLKNSAEYAGVKSRFKEAIGVDEKGNMQTNIITRYREEAQKATSYRKYMMSLDKVAETAGQYNENLQLQIECCKLVAENAASLLEKENMVSKENDKLVDVALKKNKEFTDKFGTKSIEDISRETENKSREIIALYAEKLTLFKEAQAEINSIKNIEDTNSKGIKKK